MMKRILAKLGLIFVLALGIYAGTSVLARASTTGDTKVGITFVGGNSQSQKPKSGGTGNEGIPTGKTPTKTTSGTDDDTVNGGKKANQQSPKKVSAVKTLLRAAATGRLPQTNGVQSLLLNLVGILLLLVLILMAVIYRLARKLRERE